MKPKPQERITCFKLTDDDWCPSFKIQKKYEGKENVPFVEVSFIELTNGMWRCCVWGGDDFGMEKDFSERTSAWEAYLHLVCLPKININILKTLDFIQA